MIRIRQFNPKGVFKYRFAKQQAANRLDVYLSIEKWWRDRLRDGCQLSNREIYFTRYDYRGSTSWFTHVATRALYKDYILSRHATSVKIGTFFRHFYAITNYPKRTTMPAQLMSNGEKFLRPRRCFVRFKDWSYYVELDYNKEFEAI
jgi:hypothetical protein